ncbi:MAG: hypothetical protein AAGB34_09345 [Planctomycetota bacterium]
MSDLTIISWAAQLRRIVLLFLCMPPLIGGCTGGADRPSRDWEREGRDVFTLNSESDSASAASSWTILLASLPEGASLADGQNQASKLVSLLRREDIEAVQGSSGVAVVMGRYRGANDQRAQKDLDWVRSLQVQARRPFARAYLQPPTAVDLGKRADLNVVNAQSLGRDRAKYSLQVAVYESDDREEAKEAAEEATVRFREDGEEAYFYHGPNRSMVLIGLFGDHDLDPRTNTPITPELLELKERYPHNLVNGRTITRTIGGRERAQPSMLVLIPEAP